MKPSLQFRLSQHLTLTPQLQQSIRLLQLSTVELNQEIDRMLMENPALEREDAEGEPEPEAAAAAPAPAGGAGASGSTEPAAPDTDWSADIASSWRGPDDDDEGDRSFTAPDTPTLRDHLRGQLSLTNLGDRDRVFVQLLIDALDEDGYLTQPLEEIAALLPAEAEADREELGIALRHLQNLEPAGEGALRAAQRLIQALNPRPGAAHAKVETRYVIPDVIVRKQRGVWRASLNPDAMPRLRINRLYAELAAGARNSGAAIASQLQEARWLIKNVQQRFDTILRVSQAIVDRQRHFLEHGEVAMRPLVLREIAQTLGLHESTISRVTTQKYMATPRGTFELKYFFGSHVATEAGGAASSTAIRALIKQLVAAEDAKAPLSDARISQILGEQGIVVARRTIAKYREALQIPAVNQRKAL